MRNASAPTRPCGFVRARTWQRSTSNAVPSAMAMMSMRRAHVLQRLHREVLRRHLPLEDPFQHRRALGAAEHVEAIARLVERYEEREALDVIPVGVRQQDARLAASLPERAFHQVDAEVARARAAVEDDEAAAARGVTDTQAVLPP